MGPGGSDLADVVATGFYVTGRYLLTGENAVYNGPVIPKRPLNPLFGRLGPGELSMGMSDDFEIAIEEGATIVRIGSALLGARPA